MAKYAEEKEKITVVLPSAVVREFRSMAKGADSRSLAPLIREALETYLSWRARDEFAREMAAAAKDSSFMADVFDVTKDFFHADNEVRRRRR